MRRLVPFIILLFVLAIAGGVVFGFVRAKQKRDAAILEFSLCETRFNEGQYEIAAGLVKTFLQNHPKSDNAADAYYYLASSWQNLGDSSQAMAAWSKIIEDYPTSLKRAEAYYYLGVGNQDAGQYAKAIENYKIVVSRFPNMPVSAGAWHGLGKVYEAKQEEPAAINAYQNVLEKYPNTEFAADAEKRLGDINLRRFLKENTVMYEVRRGDSLVRIGEKFRTTPELIMKLNNLKANMLQTGQPLRVLKADLNILVVLSKLKLYLKSGDRVIKTYNVGIGKVETPTPTGSFKTTDKLPHPVWYSTTPSGAKMAIQPGDPRNELGTRWIGFKRAYGIHGTIDPASIGKAMSNGCVRMHNEDVEELYGIVVSDIPVKISATTD